MMRTLLVASAVLLWVASPTLADDPAGFDAGEPQDLTDDAAGTDAGELEGTDGSRQAGDAPMPGHAAESEGVGGAEHDRAGSLGGNRDIDDSTAQALSAGQIAKNPTQYYDKKVEVKAAVATTHGTNAFTLDEDAIFAGPDVLVIAPQFGGTIDPSATVTVRGTVRQLVTAELEEDFKWFRPDSLQPDLLVRFKERPVIIAESVMTSDGKELVKTGTMSDQPAAGDAPRPGTTDPALETDEPETMDDDPLPMNQ